MQINPKVFWLTAAFLLLGAAPFYVVVVASFLAIIGSLHPIFANWQQYAVIRQGLLLSYLVAMTAMFLFGLIGMGRITKAWLQELTRSRNEEI